MIGVLFSFFEKHNKLSFLITVFGGVMIFYISSISFGPGYPGFGLNSYLYHFMAFFCFNLFLMISSVRGRKRYDLFILCILISVCYGALDELHQFFVPYRYCSFSDVLTDSFGVMFSSLIYLFRINLKNKNSNLIY